MKSAVVTAMAATATAALVASASSPAAALSALRPAAAGDDPLAPLLAAVSLAAWALIGWLLLVVAAAYATRLPGGPGRIAEAALPRLAPVAVRRVIAPLLGVTLALGVVGTVPASADALPPAPSTPLSLDWPASAGAALDWPAARPETPVVVQPGDSLWGIAAQHLPGSPTNAQIAQAWPRWWSANRAAVGTDPDLIHPGLSLTPPATADPGRH